MRTDTFPIRVPGAALAGALLLLGACAGQPEAINATPAGVTMKYEGDQLQRATEAAADHCATYGRTAQLRTTSRQAGDNLAMYDCN